MADAYRQYRSELLQQQQTKSTPLREIAAQLRRQIQEADEKERLSEAEHILTLLTGDFATDVRHEYLRRCVQQIIDQINEQDSTRPTGAAPESAKTQSPEGEAAEPDTGFDDLDGYSSGDDSDLEDPANSEEYDPDNIVWECVKYSDDGYGVYGLHGRVEDESDYRPGGHHPVRITDQLFGPRGEYRVINKLGSGGYGNVWLCRVRHRRPTEYVALKILVARESGEDGRELCNVRRLQELVKTDPDLEKYCLLPLDEFKVEGPNGIHQCFVYPVAGSPVGDIWDIVAEPYEYSRSLSRQAVEAMALFHRNGICHGDFRPANILFRLDGLNGMSEKEINKTLGLDTLEILKFENFNETSHPPAYLVKAVQLDGEFHHKFATDNICVIDFGECFEVSNPPERGAIPFPYASPELVLGGNSGLASDIWALGTTIYEICYGARLFHVDTLRAKLDGVSHCMDSHAKQNYVYWIIKQCGRLPEPLWSQWSGQWMALQETFGVSVKEDESTVEEAVLRRATIQDRINRHLIDVGDDTSGGRDAVDAKEKELFEDLLFKMTEYEPAKRLSIEQVLSHPWYSYKASKSPVLEDDQVEPPSVNSPQSPATGSPALAENGESKSITSGCTADVNARQPARSLTPQSVETKPSGPKEESRAFLLEADTSGSQVEPNVVRYRVFAISTWIRTKVGRAFRSVAR